MVSDEDDKAFMKQCYKDIKSKCWFCGNKDLPLEYYGEARRCEACWGKKGPRYKKWKPFDEMLRERVI